MLGEGGTVLRYVSWKAAYWLKRRKFDALENRSFLVSPIFNEITGIITYTNHMALWNLFDIVNSVILKSPADDLYFPAVVFSFQKHSNVNFNYNNYYLLLINYYYYYCSVGVMGIMFIKFTDIDWLFFCGILTLVCSLRACHMWLTRNHMFIREIWGKFTSFIFWNFEMSLVSLGRFQNFKKVNSVNLSQISLLNMWLLVEILLHKRFHCNFTKFLKSCFLKVLASLEFK